MRQAALSDWASDVGPQNEGAFQLQRGSRAIPFFCLTEVCLRPIFPMKTVKNRR